MTRMTREEPDAAFCEYVRRAKRGAFVKGVSVMAAVAVPLMAGTYVLGLLGYQIAHWALP